MRADRLLALLLTLQVKKRVKTRELAQLFEVSERTIHRDMDALTTAGLPVVAERGKHGGWFLLEPCHTKLTGLSNTELRALLSIDPSQILAELGLKSASEGALIKLLASLPSVQRQNAEYARQRIYIDLKGWQRPQEAAPWLPPVQEAVWQGRKLELTYERGDGSLLERTVDPLGLVVRGSIWYLVAASEGEVRTYRVARVRKACMTEEAGERSPNFELASYWERSKIEFRQNLPRYPVTARVHSRIVSRLHPGGKWGRVERLEPAEQPDWFVAHLMFELFEDACEYALGHGPYLEVLEPLELRREVSERAKATVSQYA